MTFKELRNFIKKEFHLSDAYHICNEENTHIHDINDASPWLDEKILHISIKVESSDNPEHPIHISFSPPD